jgi:hypothetical protein
VLKELSRNSFGHRNQKQDIINFLLHFLTLLIEKIPEVVLEENNMSISLHFAGGVKLTNNGTRHKNTTL